MPKSPHKSQAAEATAKAAKQAAHQPAFPVLPEGILDLDGLSKALDKPDDSLRRLLFRNYTEEMFYEWGVAATSEDIVADVPRFLSSSLRILASLSPARQKLVMLPPSIFAILADEATIHAAMAASHGDLSVGEAKALKEREDKLKAEMGRGIATRDRVLGALRGALSAAQFSTLRSAASDASSPAALAKGLRAVAGFITDIFANGTGDDKAALVAFGADAAQAEELETSAKALDGLAPPKPATGKRVSKRALDIQDGHVLVLMDIILRGFRLARRTDGSILSPELNRLATLFDTRSRAAAKDASDTPVEAPAKPSGASEKPA